MIITLMIEYGIIFDYLCQCEKKSFECVIKIVFLIFHSKHMLWVLKRTVSMRRFFRAPQTNVNSGGKKMFAILC